jgi:hypothetical protein
MRKIITNIFYKSIILLDFCLFVIYIYPRVVYATVERVFNIENNSDLYKSLCENIKEILYKDVIEL